MEINLFIMASCFSVGLVERFGNASFLSSNFSSLEFDLNKYFLLRFLDVQVAASSTGGPNFQN